PVDFVQRERAPDGIVDHTGEVQVLRTAQDDDLKLYVTARLLHLRARHAALFAEGSYAPLAASGAKAAHVFAFQRAHHDEAAIVVVPRLTCGLSRDVPIREVWGDTAIRLPLTGSVRAWRCELGGQVVQAQDGGLPMTELTGRLPVAVLTPHR
ncbi:MAG TPA: hypothetical protein VFI52_08450, partial [Gemmatimonadaceae bacterium]|nr:hypothetical protein [Gemmatimonadaceae bacterium]